GPRDEPAAGVRRNPPRLVPPAGCGRMRSRGHRRGNAAARAGERAWPQDAGALADARDRRPPAGTAPRRRDRRAGAALAADAPGGAVARPRRAGAGAGDPRRSPARAGAATAPRAGQQLPAGVGQAGLGRQGGGVDRITPAHRAGCGACRSRRRRAAACTVRPPGPRRTARVGCTGRSGAGRMDAAAVPARSTRARAPAAAAGAVPARPPSGPHGRGLTGAAMPAETVRSNAPAAARPATVAVFEPRRFERALAGNVVPARHWQRIDELDALLEQVNALYEDAGKEIERAREKGHAEGFAEGLARVQQQMTEHLAALNERRARVLADASSRVTELACAIVARIAPDFDARSVVPPLVR